MPDNRFICLIRIMPDQTFVATLVTDGKRGPSASFSLSSLHVHLNYVVQEGWVPQFEMYAGRDPS